jgi:hypothetical protein
VPASVPLYHEIRAQIGRHCPEADLPAASAERLALLVTGLIAAQSCVVAKVAAELGVLTLTVAVWVESIERRLRRTLADPHLTAECCYAPLLGRVIDWTRAQDRQGRIVLLVDESSKRDRIHLFRLSLPYRGGSLPLAWAIWEQNVALADGAYWTHVEAVLAQAAALLPPGAAVVVVADRAYAVPALIDRLRARGWHWVLRLTTTGSHRFWPERGEEMGLRELVAKQLHQPGRRWRARGRLFKDAGWREVKLVGIWGGGAKEPLVVATDLPAEWAVLDLYDRRFWIEPGFRSDKTRGWQWEQCQVRGVAHHAVLLLALAWATLVVLCVGAGEAARRLRHLAGQPARRHGTRWRTAKPQPAGESLFTLGLRQVRHWLHPTARRPWRWHLPDLTAPSWTAQWYAHQARRFIFGTPVRS